MIDTLLAWGPWGLALAAFLSGSVLSLPSEAILGALVAAGRPALPLVLIATLANVAGGCTLVFLGRGGRAVAEKRIGASRLADIEARFARFGPLLLLLSWAPIVGDAFVLVAGVLRIRWSLVIPLLLLGKGTRYAVIAGLAKGLFG